MFRSVLVANRGEIAVRVFRTLRRLGIESIAIYSDTDVRARHVTEADRSIRIGPGYLAIDAIVETAVSAGAEAVHPGYGFLSENAQFAQACVEAGVTFIGPPAAAIAAMGDKIRAKRLARENGVPVVPGGDDSALNDDELRAAALEIGFPVLLKPSAGGGGKGMRRVNEESEFEHALEGARREAITAFGDDTMLVERFIERPRHIEVQVFADKFGNTVHLYERECSLQRRHQKIVEEAPSPAVDAGTRAALGEHAITVAEACGYVGAGTVEFVVPFAAPNEHYFLEMNTRLQVEHPVTEMILGIDLVEWQLRIASGEALPIEQSDVIAKGHAIEARVYAEDPVRGFLPSGGLVVAYREPAMDHVRVDSGIETGTVVSTQYDPMLAKVVAWGDDRESARSRLVQALGSTSVLGVRTNLAFLVHLLDDPEVRAGALDTGLTDRALVGFVDEPPDEDDVIVAALLLMAEDEPLGSIVDPWSIPGGWRVQGPAWSVRTIGFENGRRDQIRFRGRAVDAEIAVGAGPARRASVVCGDESLVVSIDDRTQVYACARAGRVRYIGCGPSWWAFRVNEGYERAEGDSGHGADERVRSPMPGSVVSVGAGTGDHVERGDVLLVIEAMKMEHTVVSPVSGRVTGLRVVVGDRVGMDEELAAIEVDDVSSTASRDEATSD